ncbi:MAG: YeeE/YedE thiosulfate transporter family protein [Undibacterium sp.]|uniref:DUF6691 family protein n=1 Tax=Undibacterium sp. TaxID=1914977 RepID=UPI002720DA22|nr:DUF6691 family protein [Undibacterium sp.]MDO8650618.1 YeeE/YedE thiosulfate transporter family protein [Undibacterium sp.]
MFPLNDVGITSGLICGILFGFVLENAGFGSPCKLTAQFRLSDWSVFKVMFTAIVVAAAGLLGLRETGLLAVDAVFVPPALLVASGVGGVLVGAGFAVGGYCPGTSIVGLFSGRLDALVFIVGLLIGTFVFAGLYGPVIESLMAAGEIASGDTFTEAFGISEILLLVIMGLALVAIFYFGSWFERRSSGPVTAEQAVAGAASDD